MYWSAYNGNLTAIIENNNKHAKQIGGPCQSNRY